jgi:hypothetical protein
MIHTLDATTLEGSGKLAELGQNLGGEAVGQRRWCPVRPGRREGHPPGRSAFANVDHAGTGPAPLEKDPKALADQGVEGVGDDN